MNRSLLLIICDFLLLSLLPLARFDAPVEEETAEVESTPEATIEQDMIEVLRLSLESEREQQTALAEELKSAENTIERRDELLANTRDELSQTEDLLSEERTRTENLIEEKELISQERGTLASDLLRLREENAVERERLRLAQMEIEQKEAELQQTQDTIDEIEAEKADIEREKQEVLTELKVAETRNVLVSQQLENTKLEVEFERQQRQEAEKQAEELSKGVTALAGTSIEIKEEIQLMQPKTPSALFTQFKSNRVEVVFDTAYPGIFQERQKQINARTILITDTKATYAILHARNTPFDLNQITPLYDEVNVEIKIGNLTYKPDRLQFMRIDPRIVVIPIDTSILQQNQIEIFPVVLDPFRFSEAVVINGDENYFGESKFNVHPDFSRALQMDQKILSQLFGEFSPATGDLVLAKTGEFMGIMVNREYAGLVDHVSVTDTIWLGEAFDAERTNTIVTKLSNQVFRRL